jgi:glucosyl-3-phosphoglycerate synthase
MADFYQTGVISTLHRLNPDHLDLIEHELERYARRSKIALVLPCLYSELEGPALGNILDVLKDIRYVHRIVVSLARTSPEGMAAAQEFFSSLPQEVRFLWNDGPRIQGLYDTLREGGLYAGEDGKGRSCWMAYGYLLAAGDVEVIALHDCDIITYDREILARLCYPVSNPNLGFEFAKGFYSRVSDRMNGRATRLLVTPLLRALQSILGRLPLLVYLDSFRYPLAGEFAMKADLARVNRIPGDWGLEIGVLAEVYRNCALSRICQTELCANYDHKHQDLSGDDPERGLHRMSIDIARNLFRKLAADGVMLSESLFQTLQVQYIRMAQDTINNYHADASINGLLFDRHEEETAVAVFAHGIRIASDQYRANPMGVSLIPNWNRIASALPDFLDRLYEAVEEDSRVPLAIGA